MLLLAPSCCRYVVTGLDDFTPGPQVDAMQPHYDDAYADTAMGSSMSLAALRGQLGSAGINTTKWWLDVQGTIVQVLQEAVPKMEAHRSYYYPAARANFFTMLRLVGGVGCCSGPAAWAELQSCAVLAGNVCCRMSCCRLSEQHLTLRTRLHPLKALDRPAVAAVLLQLTLHCAQLCLTAGLTLCLGSRATATCWKSTTRQGCTGLT